ncbi:MAG: hypothetical protein KAU27_00310 [Desulfuromonadales bacterium]|nr:hypothetical protein [Desulfuromonadales bacterium]
MFKQLRLYYILVTLPFALLLIGAAIFFDAIMSTITRNPHPQINYTIFTIILIGGVLIVLNTFRLIREAGILVEFSRAIHAKVGLTALQDMANRYTGAIACLLQMVAASGGRSISHQEQVAIEHELTNARTGLVRRNALPQYFTGLLVGMGLLGTFIGLLATLNDISLLIGSFADIDMKNADPLVVFRVMIERMKAPMQSMGIAFSASMFGLLGSIILGLMMVGIRRLQGDIFQLLSSEIARHIEVALSYEPDVSEGGTMHSGGEYKVLIRIEERLAEAARLQQRTLSSEIDDFQKQRADMLRTLTEQTEASNNFRNELQQLGRQFDTVSTVIEKGNGEICSQLSEMTVHMAGDAKETRKLLTMQVDEQQGLRETLDSYKIEERLTETARLQQQALSSQMESFQKQLADMLQTFTDQTGTNSNLDSEFQQFGTQLGSLVKIMEKGNDEICTQLSALSVHMAEEATETHKFLAMQVDEQRADILRTLSEQTVMSNNFRSELQQLVSHIGTLFNSAEKSDGELGSQLSTLTDHLVGDATETRKLLAMQVDEQQGLRETLDSYKIEERLAEAARLQQRALSSEIDDSQKQRVDMLRTLTEQTEASNNFRGELQQLGRQFDTISNIMQKGNGDMCSQIAELMIHMTADAKESHKLLAMLVNEQEV